MAGVAALLVLYPAFTLAACVAAIALSATMHPDEPLRPARMGTMAIAILIPLAGPGSYFANNMENVSLTATKLVGFLSLGYLIWIKGTSGEAFFHTRQNKLLLWFGGIILLSYLVNDKSAYAMSAIWGYATLFLTFFLCVNTLTRPRHIATLLALLVIGYLISISMGVKGLSLDFETAAMRELANPERLRGASAGSAVRFGMGASVCFLLSIYHAASGRKTWQRILAGLAAPVCLYGTVAAYARSVYIATVAGLLIIAFLLRKRIRLLPVMAGILILLLMVAPFIDWVAFVERIEQIGSSPAVDRSYSARISYTMLGLKFWLQSPLIGIGPARFVDLFGNETFRFYADTFSNAGRSLHNMYLSTLCHTGIAGFAVLMMIITNSFMDLLHVRRHAPDDDRQLADYADMIIVALSVLLIASVFNPTDKFKLIWIMFGLAAALRGMQERRQHDLSDEYPT